MLWKCKPEDNDRAEKGRGYIIAPWNRGYWGLLIL